MTVQRQDNALRPNVIWSASVARAPEEHFRLLLEHVGDAVFMLDPDGRVETWTPAARRIFGYDPDQVLGKDLSLFYPAEAGQPTRDLQELQIAGADGRYEVDDWRVRADGVVFWAHVVTCPIRDEGRALLGFATIVRDLTAVRAAEDAQARYAEALERSNRELEAFASIASHDLQEPLRKILAFGDRLRTHSAEALDDKGREYLERVQHATRRMQHLVNEMLAYSRLASKTEPFEKVDLSKVAREVVEDLESRIERSGASIEIGDLPIVEGHPTQLRQLLQNLVANALKFQPAGNGPVVKVQPHKLRSHCERPGGPKIERWEIRVTDNGIGFDERYLERIFGMLQRLHGRDEYEGTGMGLAICRKIVERHHGTITARSSVGMGATFIVTLPLTQPQNGA